MFTGNNKPAYAPSWPADGGVIHTAADITTRFMQERKIPKKKGGAILCVYIFPKCI